MSTLGMRLTAALTSLVIPAAVAAGSGFAWTGQVGVLYTRNDTWLEGGAQSTLPHLDVDLRLDARGFVFAPEAVRWNAALGYRRVSDEVNGDQSALTNSLTYRLGANLFDHRTSPLRASVFASRTDTRTELGLAAAPGDVTEQALGGNVILASPYGNGLNVAYQRRSIEENYPSLPLHDRTDDLVNGSASTAAGPASIRARYDGQFSSGTWAIDDFAQHTVDVYGWLEAGPDARVSVGDTYFTRVPKNTDPGNYSADINTFQAEYRGGSTPGDILSVSYRTAHGLSETSGSVAESLSHSGQYQQDFPIRTSSYFIRGLADVTLAEQRSATMALRSTGETLGIQLWYRHQAETTTVEWNIGPKIGMLQIPDEDARRGQGANAGLRLSGPWGGYSASFSYAADWRSDLFGVSGWSVAQNLTASISGSAGAGRFTGQFVAGAVRGWSPVFGDDARRNLQLAVLYGLRRFQVDARVIFASGTVMTGAGSFSGDGLFVPVGFDAHTLTASISTTTQIASHLSFALSGSDTSVSGPGRPAVNFWDTRAAFVFRYGAFDLSVEDRYFSFPDGGDSRGNAFLLRVSRRFGSRY